jgi:tetratricopeptide (TPR) repeat protein
MRRFWRFIPAILFVLLAAPLHAQMGKTVIIQSGTPEDRALTAINAASDPAEKLALIDKFLADFGQGELAIVAYEQYVAFYLSQKNYDKAGDYSEKILGVDPDNFAAAVNLIRAASEKKDTAKLFAAGERVAAIIARYKAAPPPEGRDSVSWPGEKAKYLNDAQENIRYTEYQLFTAAYQAGDPAARAALMERFIAAFPDSAYASNARDLVVISYQQARNFPKMTEAAEKTLAQDPKHPTILVLLADYYSEQGASLDKAESYAKQAIDQLGSAAKPEGVAEPDWQKQISLQKGVAWSALGQIYITQRKDSQALEAFRSAAPLVKPDATSYARNQYRMGFALINLKRIPEARTALTEAASVESPYRALAQAKLKELPAAPARPGKKSS